MDEEYRIEMIYPRDINIDDVAIWNHLTEIHAKGVKYTRVKAGEMINKQTSVSRNSVLFSFTGTVKVYEEMKEFINKLNIYALISINDTSSQ